MKKVISPALYKGTSDSSNDARGYYSNNALQAVMYAVTKSDPIVLMINHQPLYDYNDVKSELGVVENLWYLDHAYGRDSEIFYNLSNIKPGVYDADVGEALINDFLPSVKLSGHKLYDEIINSYEESGGSNDITDDTVWVIFNKRGGALRRLFLDHFDDFEEFMISRGWDI